MLKFSQLDEATMSMNLKPGSFNHFVHHVKGAAHAEENDITGEKLNHHWGQLWKHYKPGAEYSKGTDLHDIHLGDDEADMSKTYSKYIVPKSKAAKENYGK